MVCTTQPPGQVKSMMDLNVDNIPFLNKSPTPEQNECRGLDSKRDKKLKQILSKACNDDDNTRQ